MRARGLKCWVHLNAPIGLIECQGALRLDTVPQVRDAVWKVVTDQPDAIVLDLAGMTDVEQLSASVFPALARAVAAETDSELILAAPSAGVRRAVHRVAPRCVRIFETLSQAMEAATRGPVRRRVTHRLSATPDAPCRARWLIDEVCRRWQLDGLREPALVVASELVTNAVQHGGPPIDLCVIIRYRVLRIEVSDDSPAMSAMLAARPEGMANHGLRLVEALAQDWGAVPTTRGKTVWADLVILPGPDR